MRARACVGKNNAAGMSRGEGGEGGEGGEDRWPDVTSVFLAYIPVCSVLFECRSWPRANLRGEGGALGKGPLKAGGPMGRIVYPETLQGTL